VTGAAQRVKKLTPALSSLKTGIPKDFSSDYTFTVLDTQASRVAKITVNPKIKYTGSKAKFTYDIGIEKRAIQLSPELTKELIDKLDKTIKTFNQINDNLKTVTNVMEKACLAIGAALNIKNLIAGANGEAVARSEVMDHWKVYCAEQVNDGKYKTQSQCYYDKSNEIDADVEEMAKKMNAQDSELKEMQKKYTTKEGLLGEKVVDTANLTKDYAAKVKAKLESFKESTIENSNGDEINLRGVASRLTYENWKEGVYDLEDLKAIDLYLDSYASTGSARNKDKLVAALYQVAKNSEYLAKRESDAKKAGVDLSQISSVSFSEDLVSVPYRGLTLKDLHWEPKGSSPEAQFLKDANVNYLWSETTGNGSLSLSFEAVLVKAKDADLWLSPSYYGSLEQLEKANPLYANFKAFQNKSIYTFVNKKGGTGGVLYYELGTARPDLVLKDLIKIAHPELLVDYTPYFFEKLK